jgi:hypothetical protein
MALPPSTVADYAIPAILASTQPTTGGVTFGAGGYLLVSDPAGLLHYNKWHPWTVFASVKTYSYPPSYSATGGYRAGIIWTTASYGPYGGYEAWIDENGRMRVRIMSDFVRGDYLGVVGMTNIVDDQRHTVAFSYDGSTTSGGIKLYIDGKPERSSMEPGSAWQLRGDLTGNEHGYTIGNQLGGHGSLDWSQGFMWPGTIYSVIQDGLLHSPGYIAKFAPSTSTEMPAPSDPGTSFAIELTERAGSVAHDATGHGFNATLVGSVFWQ